MSAENVQGWIPAQETGFCMQKESLVAEGVCLGHLSEQKAIQTGRVEGFF